MYTFVKPIHVKKTILKIVEFLLGSEMTTGLIVAMVLLSLILIIAGVYMLRPWFLR